MRAKVLHQVGPWKRDSGIHLGGLQGGKADKPDKVEFDSGIFYVGENVEYYTEPSSGFDFGRLFQGPEGMALGYAVLAKVLPKDTVTNLYIGLPVDAWKQREDIHKRWLGKHKFLFNEDRYQFNFKNVLSLPQPGAALLEQGNYDGTRMVLDIGFNTTDIFAMDGLRIVERYVGGSKGVSHAVKRLQEMIKAKFQIECTPQEVDKWLRGDTSLYLFDGEHDISDMVNGALEDTANYIANYFKDTAGDDQRRYKLYVVGGGALLLGNYLTKILPFAEIVNEPVFAVARGLKLAAEERWGGGAGLDPGFGQYKAVA